MITYGIEEHQKIRRQGKSLFRTHWQEVGSNRETRELAPAWVEYSKLNNAGRLISIGVRDNGGLVGYSFVILGIDMHASKNMTAYVDAMFLSHGYRKGREGINFVNKIIELVGENKAISHITFHTKSTPDLSPLLERAGCNFVEKIYCKALK